MTGEDSAHLSTIDPNGMQEFCQTNRGVSTFGYGDPSGGGGASFMPNTSMVNQPYYDPVTQTYKQAGRTITFEEAMAYYLAINPGDFSGACEIKGTVSYFYSNGSSIEYDVERNGAFTFVSSSNIGLEAESGLPSAVISEGCSIKENTSLKSFLDDLSKGINAAATANGLKTELLEFAVRTDYKTGRTWKAFNELTENQQIWRTTRTLGKSGAKYLNFAKNLGVAAAVMTSAYSVGKMVGYYQSGGTDSTVLEKTALDVVMTGVAFFGPIGFGVSAAYFILEASTDGFGGFGSTDEK